MLKPDDNCDALDHLADEVAGIHARCRAVIARREVSVEASLQE